MSDFMNFRPQKKFVDYDAKTRLSLSITVLELKLHHESPVKMKATLGFYISLALTQRIEVLHYSFWYLAYL